MKKLLVLVMTVAMAATFMPKVAVGEEIIKPTCIDSITGLEVPCGPPKEGVGRWPSHFPSNPEDYEPIDVLRIDPADLEQYNTSANLNLKVTFDLEKPVEPVIAIELSNTALSFEGMKLGEVRSEAVAFYNKGNVPLMADIRYGNVVGNLIVGNDTAGVDTFATRIDAGTYASTLGLEQSLPIMWGLKPSQMRDFKLIFLAPTAITKDVNEGLSITYEIRAYLDDTKMSVLSEEKE